MYDENQLANIYPSAEEVYKGAETMVQDEDAQPLTTPMVEPLKEYTFEKLERQIPKTTFSFKYLANLTTKPQRIRNIAICGALHHGKTLLMDMLVQQTHEQQWSLEKEHKYSDQRQDEIDKHMSIKSTPMSFVLQDGKDKSYLINAMDTPGHPNFVDEAAAAMRIADGVLLVVDVVEGVTMHTESLIKHILGEGLKIILVVNKLDRLPLELRLPPSDAYLKLKAVIEKVNFMVQTHSHGKPHTQISPTLGNVVFASSRYGALFTLKSYSEMHLKQSG